MEIQRRDDIPAAKAILAGMKIDLDLRDGDIVLEG